MSDPSVWEILAQKQGLELIKARYDAETMRAERNKLLGELADVHAAMGDPEARLSPAELVDRARSLWKANQDRLAPAGAAAETARAPAAPVDAAESSTQDTAAEAWPPADTCIYPLCKCPFDHPGTKDGCLLGHPHQAPLGVLRARPEYKIQCR